MAQNHGKIGAMRKKLAVFASGTGTNVARLIEHFKESTLAEIVLLVCNKQGAGVIEIAQTAGIPVLMIEKETFFRGNGYVDELKEAGADFLILAGFLWKLPASLIRAWPQQILNIHPALLPKYGGKGMYGQFVHEAVIAAGEQESGITIHVVDEQYDHGASLFQATCPVHPEDTPATLAARVHQLEHRHYPLIVEQFIAGI